MGKQGYLYSYNLIDPKVYLSFLFSNEETELEGFVYFRNRNALIADIVFSEDTYLKNEIFQLLVNTKVYNKGWEFNNNTLTYDRFGLSIDRFRIKQWQFFEYLDFGFKLNVDWGEYFFQKPILGLYLKMKKIDLFKNEKDSIALNLEGLFSPTIDRISNSKVNFFFLGGAKFSLLFNFSNFKFLVDYGYIYLTKFSYERERENKYIYIKIKSNADFNYTNEQSSNYPVLLSLSENAISFINGNNEIIKQYDVSPLSTHSLVDPKKSWLVVRAYTRNAENSTPPHNEAERIASPNSEGQPVINSKYASFNRLYRQGNNSTKVNNEIFYHESEIIYRFPLNDFENDISASQIDKIKVSFNLKYSVKYQYSFDNETWIEVFSEKIDDDYGAGRRDLGEAESTYVFDDLKWQGNTNSSDERAVSFEINFSQYKNEITGEKPIYLTLNLHHLKVLLQHQFEIFDFSFNSSIQYELNIKDFVYEDINLNSKKLEKFHLIIPMMKLNITNQINFYEHSIGVNYSYVNIDQYYHESFFSNDTTMDNDYNKFIINQYGNENSRKVYKSYSMDRYQPYLEGLFVEKDPIYQLSLNKFWKKYLLEGDKNHNGHIDIYENDLSPYFIDPGTLSHKIYVTYSLDKIINFDFFYRNEVLREKKSVEKKNHLLFVTYHQSFLDLIFVRYNFSDIQDEVKDDLYYEIYYEEEAIFSNVNGVFLKDNFNFEDKTLMEFNLGVTNSFQIPVGENINFSGENYLRGDYYYFFTKDNEQSFSILGEGYEKISFLQEKKKKFSLQWNYQFRINFLDSIKSNSAKEIINFNSAFLLNYYIDPVNIYLGNSFVNMNNYPFFVKQLINTSMVAIVLKSIANFSFNIGYKYMFDIYQLDRVNHLIFASVKLEI